MAGLKRAALLAVALSIAASPLYAADRPISVDVSLGDVSINKVPNLIAADAGLYAKYGLDVHQFITPGAARAAAGSGVVVPQSYVRENAGDAPISVGGGSPMINGAVRNANAKPRMIVTTQEDIVTDHVVAKPGINTIADLKGKRLGFSGIGTVTHFDALSLSRKMGWVPGKDITLVQGGAALSALKDDKVDALLGSAMVFALAPAAGFKDIADLTPYKMPLAGSSIMVDKAFLAANRDTVLRFVKATIEATALMKKDRKVFDAAIAKWFNIKDAKTLDGMFAVVNKFEAKPYPAVEGVKMVFTLYDSPEMRKRKPEEFYDSSLVAELDKSGFLANPK